MRKNSGLSNKRTAAARLEIKAAGDDGTFEGYGSIFDQVDSYSETVARGAFLESLKQHEAEGTLPALLWQHNPSQPIGVYTEMREDEKGLFVKGQLTLETQMGKEAHALLKAGALNGLSIGFMPVKWEDNSETKIRKLVQIDLWEVSLVTFPANDRARVDSVKSSLEECESLKDVERQLRDSLGVSQDEATAIVARVKRIDQQYRDGAAAKSGIMASVQKTLDILKS